MEELLNQSRRFEEINSKLGKAINQAKAHLRQIERTLENEQGEEDMCETLSMYEPLVRNANRFLN